MKVDTMNELLEFLSHRRSVSINKLEEPGPNKKQIHQILTIAARVPDHGKLCPWRFIVLEGESRKDAGKLLAEAWLAENPDAAPAKLDFEAERFQKAPIVIAVVSHIREAKYPAWEQILSAGAACFNLCLAANALGYGTNWVTGWYSYSEAFGKAMGLGENEQFAGFLNIGSYEEQPVDRERPVLSEIVTYWEPIKASNV